MFRKVFSSLGFLILLVLALVCAPAAAEESFEAGTMRLLQYLGDVQILDLQGVPRFVMENVRFASGETMVTGAESSASVGLDDTKIVTLDAATRVEFIQEGEHMLLNLEEGAVFVDVSEKLDENASFDIQTTTMTVGIRGTLIYAVTLPKDGFGPSVTTFGVLEGSGLIDTVDSSGAHRVFSIGPGELVTAEQSADGQGASFDVREMTSVDIQGFVQDTVNANENLQNRVLIANPNGEQLLSPPADEEGDSARVTEIHPAGGTWVYTDPVQLVAQSASKLYDGNPLSRRDDVLVSGLPVDCSIEVSAAGSLTNAGTEVNRVDKYTIYNSSGEDVTGHFTNISTVDGTLRVDPAPLTVWTGGDKKVYDGEPLTCEDAGIRTVSGYVAEEPVWRNSSVVTRTALGAETMVGISGSVWVHGSNPVTGEQKEIELKTGQQLIVSVSSEDGQESITFSVVDLAVKDLPDNVISLYAENPDLMVQACTDVPTWDPAELQARVEDYKANNTAGESTVVQNGLNVPKSAGDDVMTDSSNVRISIDSGVTNYNTQVLTGTEAHFTPITLDPTIKIIPTGTQTAVGESENTCEIKWGNADPDNYTVSYDLGKLTVEALEVEISCGGYNTSYSGYAFIPNPTLKYLNGPHAGESISSSSLTARLPGALISDSPLRLRSASKTYHFVLFTGDTLDLVISGFGTAPGTYTLTGSVTSSSENLGSVNLSFSGTKVVISPAVLTITTGSATKEYDGSALTCSEVSVSGLMGSDTVTVTATGTQTDTGSSQNTYTIDWGDTDPDNYTIEAALGTLTVTAVTPDSPVNPDTPDPQQEPTAVTVTVTGNTASKEYNGAEQAAEGYTVTISDPAYTESDFTFSGAAKAAGTDPGAYAMGLSKDQFKNNNTNFEVTFSVTDGSLEIKPVETPITITAADGSKAYDGQPLTNPGCTFTEDVLAEGDELTATVEGTITEVGKAANKVTGYKVMRGETDITDNYTFADTVDGTLEVTPAEVTVTVTGTTDTKTYSGEEQTAEGYTVSISSDLYTEEDFTFSGTAKAAGTDAGTYPMGLAEDQFLNDNTNFDVTFSVTDGALEISPVDVTVTITGATDTKTYNGEEQAVEGYTVAISDPAYTEADFTFSGTAKAGGTNAGTYLMGLGASMFTNTNDNFSVTFSVTDGRLTISKAPLSVTTPNDSMAYSGESLPTTTDLPTVDGLIGGESVTIANKPNQLTDAGQTSNQYIITWDSALEDNYEVTEENLGTLKIDPLVIELCAYGENVGYDGDYHGAFLGASCDDENYEVVSTGENTWQVVHYTGSGITINVTTSGGGINADTYPVSVASYTGSSDNFTISVYDAGDSVIISKADVTVTIKGNTGTATYDGSEKSVTGYTVESISNSLYQESYISFSGTAEAKGTDADTYAMGLSESNFTNNNGNFSVNFSVTDGSLTINPADVTVAIVGNTGTEVYDGSEKSVTGYSVTSISNSLYSESYITLSGTAEAKGTDQGTYPMGLSDTSFSNNNGNFNVTFTVTDGSLKIEKLAISVTLVDMDSVPSAVYTNGSHASDGSLYPYLTEHGTADGDHHYFNLFTGDTLELLVNADFDTTWTYTLTGTPFVSGEHSDNYSLSCASVYVEIDH